MQVGVVGRGFGRFYAALRQTPRLLKIGNVWPRDGPRGPGIPGAESASGTPGKRAIFRQPVRSGSFFSGSRRGSEARVPSIRRARNASPDMFAAKSSSVCHVRGTAHPFSGSEVTYVPSLLGCALTHPSDEDKYVTSDPENGRAVHLK